ncbi:MAG: hypothetical protein RL409_2651 [Gemmatimonadota bacterium]
MTFPQRIGKPCQYCGGWVPRSSNLTRAKYCGRACAAKARPRASRVAAGRKGGLAKVKTPTDWAAIALLSPVAAFRLGRSVRKAWLGNRMQEARRAGYDAGYEAACESCANLGWRTA